MKKLLFVFVALAAISFTSCGNKTEDVCCEDTIDTVVVDTPIVDSTLCND